LNIWQTADISYAKIGTLEVTKPSTLNTLNVLNQSIFSGISCEHLKVNQGTTLNQATLSSAMIGTLQVTGNSSLDTIVCDSVQGNEATFLDAFITDISGLNLDVSFLNVSSLGVMEMVTCETLEVYNGSVFNGATFVDISVSNLDVSFLDVVDLSVNGHSDLADVSCETLEANRAIFKDTIYYQAVDRSIVIDIGPLFWIVAGESVSRINATHQITLTNILQGTLFGKKYWTPKAGGIIQIEQDFTASVWAAALVFGVSTSGVLFSTISSSIVTNHIVYNGQTLSVNGDISGISIPAFSVMVVNKEADTYYVYMNGVLSYSSNVAASTITDAEPQFGGAQLLACALWNTTLSEAQIETLTLETLT
jgi:hypothetical protein